MKYRSNKIADIIKRLELSNSKKKDGSGRKFRNLLTALKSHIALLDNRLKKDECSDNPCKNGATCIDLYNKFMCICPSHFEGETCENRIDECSIYQGTPAGCQNNASCILNPDGFHCVCQQGFHGALCQLRATACEFSLDLCGPAGHCIPTQPDPETNEPGYRCLCEWGYRSSADRNNPVCEDVNECESNPCYPGTTCINLPGSFKCAGCPPGMTGNGMICLDVDECASEDLETCSKDPPVKCINTIGSYECASCPPGYKGNGHICKKQSPCELSPCHPKAKCYNMGMSSLNEEGFRCECPLGMIGDGIGTEGCYHSNVTLCRADTCYNQGTCQIISEEAYKCHCKWGYVGKRCELATACLSNICRSRGECLVKKDGSFECVCLKGYYGPTCEYEEDGCGGHIINETGVIKYPDWTWYHFGRNKTCEWIIIVNELNKACSISATCATADANVTLRDGEHANSPLVGVFCGPRGSTTVPVSRPIYFSSNKAYIAFVSGKSTTGIGNFALHWRTVEKKCGERIYSDDGQISLYGYKRSEICQWHVSVDPKMHIEITVEPMKLASGDVRNCSVNSLELFDGLEIDETERILHLCSSETTRTLVRTTLPYFTAYFRSNYPADFPEEHCDGDSLCSRGFTIHYRTIKLDKDCGGTILPDADDAFEGYIQSPNYGFNYFPNLDCLWLLDASAVANVYDAKVIKVEIVDLDIPSAPARSIKETSHFRLSFSESTAPNQRLVNLIRPCRFDHITRRGSVATATNLRVKNGEDTSHPILGRYCNGRRPEGPIVSSGPKMVIQFHSNQSINGKGFKIHYSAACEKHFTSSNGTIQSSNYPNGSTQPFKCTYVIDAEKTKAIRLKFNFIGLNTDIKTCFYDVTKHNLLEDYVEFSGGHDSHDQINKRYVCARYPFVAPDGEMVTSASRSLKITLSSSGISNKGILFLYEQFDVGCGGIFEGESGQITSPNYPEKYLAHMYCIYVISTPNKRIRLTFEVFELEVVPSREDCSFDSIEIYDTYVNDDDHSELHGRYCGTLLPPPILSTGNRLTIVFKSDRSVNGAGFMAKWQIVDDKIDCHRTYTATSGRIIIHAETEMKFVQCDYQIAFGENQILESSVTIGGQQNHTKTTRKFCDRIGKPVWILTENEVVDITFSSKTEPENHFWLSWSNEGCGGDITSPTTALVTFQGGPYERAYLSGDDERAHNIGFVLYISLVCGGTLYAGNELKTFQLYVVKEDECKFLIKAEDGQRIYFRLDQIRFNRHRASKVRSKSSATVVIYDGIQEDSSTLGMYHLECSPSNSEQISRACANRELRSTGSVLSVYLKGLNTMHLEHIHFSYSTQIESCGGTIHSIAGVIYYPFIENDFECEWFINNTEGNKVELEIFKLKLPFSEYCAESYLEVRESNSSGKIVTRACSFEDVMPTMISRAFWIRLRYSGSEDDSSDIEPLKPELMIKFKKGHALIYIFFTLCEYEFIGFVVFGGMTNDGVVSSPIAEDWQSMHFTPVEWTLIGEDDHWLRISIKSIDIPDERDENNLDIEQRDSLKGLVFNEGICTLNGKNDGCGRVEFVHAGYIPPNDFFIKSNLATVLFNAPPGSSFRFVWENIPLTMVNTSLPKANQGINEDFMREFTCGGTLTATFDPQYLTNPGGMSTDGKFTTILPLTSTIEVWRSINMYRLSRWRGGYGNNLKCRWTIIRPMFAGVMLKIISMDLEEHIDCRFDYIAISSDLSGVSYDDGQLVGNVVKFCKHRDVGTKELFSSEEAVTIFFMTDRNRGGRGFVIEYKLVCQSFDYIPISLGVFDQTIQSPNYPNEYNNNLSCSWSIMLESSRPILAKFLTMDIEESPSCKKDGITMHSSPIYADGNANDRLCGSLSGWNKTFSNGRLFIGFATDSNTAGKGFQLQLKEQIHDCSSDRLILTEGDLPKVLTSPGFPKTSPNSLDCIWTISAPSGHRIKFTVDPISFNLEDSSMEDVCSGNYLEVRDGPSKLSPLVGRYCGKEPPSTIFSTGSYLNIQYQTDSFVHFSGWNATYEIASCGGSVIIPMNGNRVIISPNYPEPYPSQATCDWTVVAPRGHYVNATFDHLWILFTENCTEDSVALRERGEYILKPVCVFNAVRGKHFTSSQNIMVVSFRSNNTVGRSSRLFCLEKKCGFHLSLVPSKIECGGDVNDDSGYITAPGYPNQLQTHIMCDWTFRAGIGFRYVFDFAFVKHETKYNEVGCYPDIYIANGLNRPVDYYGFVDHIFCSNETQFVSTADLITIRYDDRAAMYEKQNMKERGIPSEKVYAPFRITYLKVPAEFDENACMYHVRRNKTIELRSVNVSRYSVATSPNIDYCHLLIERQFVVGTTVLRFKNFSSSENSFWKPNSRCLDTESYVLVTALGNEPWPFEARFCDGSFKKTANFTVALPHRSFDIHVFQKLHLSSISFNLTVQFLPCGGLIQGPESGILTSPGFYGKENSTYEPDTQCVWSLKAPEGQIVKIKITDMDLEYNVECKHDFLKLFEGGGTDASLVHVYCNNPQDEPIQDRFREVKSRGRYLTLYFFTDMSIERRGFRLEYSFSGFEDECGFTTNRMTGTVISPRNPQDYPNHIYCLWDISVPFGYHVALYFHRFDVQQSGDCSKDYVKISQEHHSRAIAPVGGYYFMFDHEEELKKICGYETPPVFHSESNRIKIEFKSDGKITGKGFNITWKSECGTTFRLNHGVVTSPHYPRFYPNEDMECDYLIEPEYDGTLIITLRILDLELDPYIYDYSRQPCNTDFLELRDVSAKRVIDTFCANSDISSEIAPISVKGPVGVRFVSNTSVFEDLLNRRKHRRGFKISYALSKCGGEINFKEEKELMSVVISSPGFPLPYHHNLDCVWNISAPEKRVISIKHTHLDLEESSDCLFDFVEFFDGSQISNATSMGKFCGAVVPSNQLSTTGRFLVVRFYSDRSANRGGFRIIATASLGPDGGCGGEINVDNSYELIAPLNPKTGQYYNFLRCGWTLKAPTGKILEMRLKDLELEAPDAETGRCYDYIAVYDGYKTISPMLLSNTCKIVEQLPLIMKSSYRVLHIYFESDSDKTFKGFTMEFKTITAPCGGRRTAATEPSELQYESEKMLTRIFPKHQRCRWIIYSKERIPLRVEFSQFSFPSLTPDCTDEYMEIRDAGTPADCHHPACRDTSNGLQIVRLCGSTLPADFISGTSVIQITISAILQSEHTARFRLSYQTLNSCNRVIATQQSMTGHITSPNYPNPYDHNSSCYTTLTALTGYQIFLVFKDFKLEKVRRSFNGQLSTSIREMLTGERNFGPFQNVIDQYSGLYRNEFCEYDYVEIIDSFENRTERYCDYKLPPSFLSSSNTLEIYFKSDSTMAPGGYDAYYYTVRPSDSLSFVYYDFGIISEPQGAITNVGYPGYKNRQRMRWRIDPPNGHKCKLILLTMDFGKNINGECTEGDHLVLGEIGAEGSENTPLNYLPCRDAVTLPKEIPVEPGTSTLLEFYTDDDTADNGDGFRVEWICENYYIMQV
ncbi:unnamed protein product [Brugia pahangi]|uniref:Cubilin n=1 Tax=Brugia pahangi TaxID=6280 RepID=A0A158PSA1_BRUPA|nr:unnamed protein product [Brugia pahangi]